MVKIKKLQKGLKKHSIITSIFLVNLIFIFMALNVGHACDHTSHTNGRSPLLIGGGDEFIHFFHGLVEAVKFVKF